MATDRAARREGRVPRAVARPLRGGTHAMRPLLHAPPRRLREECHCSASGRGGRSARLMATGVPAPCYCLAIRSLCRVRLAHALAEAPRAAHCIRVHAGVASASLAANRVVRLRRTRGRCPGLWNGPAC
eukprot:330852-Chlamydomonas_euryale.AAC.4